MDASSRSSHRDEDGRDLGHPQSGRLPTWGVGNFLRGPSTIRDTHYLTADRLIATVSMDDRPTAAQIGRRRDPPPAIRDTHYLTALFDRMFDRMTWDTHFLLGPGFSAHSGPFPSLEPLIGVEEQHVRCSHPPVGTILTSHAHSRAARKPASADPGGLSIESRITTRPGTPTFCLARASQPTAASSPTLCH